MHRSDDPIAVVAGAGIAGLLAAAALRHLGPIVIVEPNPEDAWDTDARNGVPHGQQLHNLLGRAQRHLEELAPGTLASLAERGGVQGTVAGDTYVVEYGEPMPRTNVGLSIWSATRRALEESFAGLVLNQGVTRLAGKVIGAELDADGVVGAVVRTDDTTTTVNTRLLVDATGRRAAGIGWLMDHGRPAPPTTTLSTRQWYASAAVAAPTSSAPPFIMVFPTRTSPYGGLVSPAGAGASRISLNGSVGAPPRTPEDFARLARSLADPAVAAVLDAGSSSSGPPKIHAFGTPRAAWNHYERLDQPPAGLLPLGDAVANLSPLFGQGVSGAAWEAIGLREAFADTTTHDPPGRRRATRAYLRHCASVRRAMWDLMTVQQPGGPGDLDDDEVERLVARLASDPAAHTAYVRMWHLLAPVDVLPALVRGDPVDDYVEALAGGAT